MFIVDRLILIGAVLLLFGIVSSKFSARLGLPTLVLFIAVGMLAGSEGLGGIAFENYALAHGVGTIALAVILFDGGLRTSVDSFRLAWKPSLALATFGVLLTAAITGWASTVILGLSPLEGLLLGSIVGSTDAAAVFSILRSQGLRLRERVSATLEVESGSNDPMAVFLTVGLIGIITGEMEWGPGLAGFLLRQFGVGAVAGLAVGVMAATLINRINLASAGLYPLLTGALGLLSYGLAASLGGSGFLSVYLTGIVLGNTRLVFQRGTYLFHDAVAWVCQIAMFVVLGLLSFPSRLVDVAWQGLAIAFVLIFIARPVSVALTLLPFRFAPREIAFLSWVGLKGAVPIVLATYPLLLGVPDSLVLFNVVFFVVLVSALTQGWSLPFVARRLGLELPSLPAPPVSLEITSLRDVDGDIVEYTLPESSRAAGRRVRDLLLPDGVVIAMVARHEQIIPPRGSTHLRGGDHVFVVMRPDARALVDRVFGEGGPAEPALAAEVEFVLRGDATVADVEEFYGVVLDADGDKTLARLLAERLDGMGVRSGDRVRIGDVELCARDVHDGIPDAVALVVFAKETVGLAEE